MKTAARRIAPAPPLAPAVPVAEAVRARVGDERFNLWFATNASLRVETGTLVVGVANLHLQEFLQKKFATELRDAAQAALGVGATARFHIDATLFQAARKEQAAVQAAPPPTPTLPPASFDPPLAPPPAARPRKAAEPPPTLFDAPAPSAPAAVPNYRAADRGRRWHHLAEFVVGACNRVAYASALSVVESPGDGANPLVLHGPVGTGKTHLLEGIYAGVRKRSPDAVVRYVTAEDFTNRFVAAVHTGKAAAFRKQFRECDVLLLDDLHFLATKRATQEEFLHTFDALIADGGQLVVTCDCHPRLSDDFLPELADRLLGGAVWGLQPPDATTRLDLLRSKCARAGALIDDAVLQFIAERFRGNVRELEGALVNLRHFARVTGQRVDVQLAREALGDLLRHAVRVVKLADVDAAVCQVLRLPAGTLQSAGRAWSVSHPRMLAVFLARKHTTASYSEIGQHFGNRNHSTAVAAEKKVRQWLQANESLTAPDRRVRAREVVEQVERLLGK